MENLVHRKSISLNDFPQSTPFPFQQTALSYLNDGYESPSRCTTIDSTRCRNGEPRITIDLNRSYFIHGVIIQQLDTCKRMLLIYVPLIERRKFLIFILVSHLSQDDYLSRLQLDRIIVYITQDMYLDAHRYSQVQCSVVTRKNYGILSPRIHFQCQTPIMGRFIHIHLLGIRTITNRTQSRLSLPFKAHFCEIYAYN